MRKIFAIILILSVVLLLQLNVFAVASGSVVKVTGKVMVQAGNGAWKPVVAGMQIAPNMKLKIEANSICVLKVGSTQININKSGVFPAIAFLNNPANAANIMRSGQFNSLIQGNMSNVSTVAGVRADEGDTALIDQPIMLDDPLASGNALIMANYFLKTENPKLEGAILSLSEERIELLSAAEKDDAYNLLGWCYFQSYQLEEAVAAFSEALALNPDKDTKKDALLFKAIALNNMADYEASIQVCDKILNDSQMNEIWEQTLGINISNSLSLGDNDTAMNYLEQLKSDYPDSELIANFNLE